MQQPIIRYCYYCRQVGHMVKSCNHQDFRLFQQLCFEQIRILYEPVFDTWLSNYAARKPHLVKCFAVRYCGMRITNNLSSCTYQVSSQLKRQFEENIVQMNQQMLESEREEAMALLILDVASLIREEAEQQANRKFELEMRVKKDVEEEEGEESICDICYESVLDAHFVLSHCEHKCCKECMKRSLRIVPLGHPPRCAFCRSTLERIDVTSDVIREEFMPWINSCLG
jgi:hypothetical protein